MLHLVTEFYLFTVNHDSASTIVKAVFTWIWRTCFVLSCFGAAFGVRFMASKCKSGLGLGFVLGVFGDGVVWVFVCLFLTKVLAFGCPTEGFVCLLQVGCCARPLVIPSGCIWCPFVVLLAGLDTTSHSTSVVAFVGGIDEYIEKAHLYTGVCGYMYVSKICT